MSRPPYFIKNNFPPNIRNQKENARNFVSPVQQNIPLINNSFSVQSSSANENQKFSYGSNARPSHTINHSNVLFNRSSSEYSQSTTGVWQSDDPQGFDRKPFYNAQFTKPNVSSEQNINRYTLPSYSANFLQPRPTSGPNANPPPPLSGNFLPPTPNSYPHLHPTPPHSVDSVPPRPNCGLNLIHPPHSVNFAPSVPNSGPNLNPPPPHSSSFVPSRANNGYNPNPAPPHLVNFAPLRPNCSRNSNLPQPQQCPILKNNFVQNTHQNLLKPGNVHSSPIASNHLHIDRCKVDSVNSKGEKVNFFSPDTAIKNVCEVPSSVPSESSFSFSNNLATSVSNIYQSLNMPTKNSSVSACSLSNVTGYMNCPVPNQSNLSVVNFNNAVAGPSVFSVPTHLPPPNVQCNLPLSYPPPLSKMILRPSFASSTTEENSHCEKVSKLSEFLKRFSLDKTTTKDKDQVVVPEFRSSLSAGIALIKQLQQCKLNLSNSLESNDDVWNAEVNKMLLLKNKLSEICALVSDPKYLQTIIKKLQIIKKKRDQKKRTKLNKQSKKLKKEQYRKERHQKIDKWFDDIKEKQLKQKREAEMKKEADYILLEVRKKIHEAKRTIEKLKVFEKLRNVRQANALQKGLHILPEHNKNFDEKISTLKRTMQRQLEDYEAEEKAMKVMLETEQEGQIEEENQWKMKKVKAIQRKKQMQIIECLFGNSEDPEPTDPLYLFHQFQTSANSSIDSLVNIRCQWDVHLAEDGQAIPQKWVLPPPPSNPNWEACLLTGASKSQKV